MATANCTVNSFRSYNNGWTSWQTPSTKVLGAYCFGKFTSNNQNFYRYLVIKITTPTYPTGASAKKLNINIPLWRTSAGTDTWYCAITTTNSTSCPTTWVTSRSIYNTNSYTTRTFTTNEFNFISNTTYYVWLYSPTPVGNSTIGTYANNHSYGANGAKISVSTTYTVDTASGNFKKPGKPKLYGYKGSYSGCQIIIPKSDFDATYPDIFVGNSPTDIYYRRTTVTETNDGWVFNIDASTSVRTLYITRRKLNPDGSHAANAAFNISANYYQLYTPPLYACQIYCNSDTPLIFDSKSESGNTYVIDGLTAKGLTTSPTSTTPEISITSGLAWRTNGTKLEGKTWYMLYDSTKTATLYCGGNTTHTLSSSLRHYGTGSVLVKSTTLDGNAISDIEDFPACESNSSFSVPYIMPPPCLATPRGETPTLPRYTPRV